MLIYWDANIFLSHLEATGAREPLLNVLRMRAALGEVELATSVLTVTEVAWLPHEATSTSLDDDVAALLDALWESLPGFRLIDIDRIIARGARDLMRAALPRGWRLKPNDAIHLATAAIIEADVVHTYDRTLWKYGELLGIPMHEPRDPA